MRPQHKPVAWRPSKGGILRNLWLVLAIGIGSACATPVDDAATSDDLSSKTLDQHLAKVIAENHLTGDPAHGLNQPSPELVHLGQALFFDKILGGEKDVSCASCHHPLADTADDLRLSRGVGGSGVGIERARSKGQLIPRNAPAVWNTALFAVQFWDGRVSAVDPNDPSKGFKTPDGIHQDVATALAAQAMFPVTSAAEMRGSAFPGANNFQVRAALAQRVADIPDYHPLFAAAFGDDQIDPPRIATAIGAYETHLTVVDTPWFRYVRGDHHAVSKSAKRGAIAFYDTARCQRCHSGDMGTDLDFHSLAIPQFGPGKGNGADTHDDFGRENVTHDARDQYKFRTPPLVNVGQHAPYGHDGAYQTLEAVVRHHLDPIRAVQHYDKDSGTLQQVYAQSLRDPAPLLPTLDPALQTPTHLSDGEVDDLLAFLGTQTDPRTLDLSREVPDSVPSGLPLDR